MLIFALPLTTKHSESLSSFFVRHASGGSRCRWFCALLVPGRESRRIDVQPCRSGRQETLVRPILPSRKVI